MLFRSTLLEISPGLSVQRDQVAIVKGSEDGKSTAIFTPGQSAIDGGFYVDKKYDAVMDMLHSPEADVVKAAKALLDKLDEAAEELQRLAQMAFDQNVPYSGPHFIDEMDALRTALEEAE